MKKQVERTFCDWEGCEDEADNTRCAICRGDFCLDHVVYYTKQASFIPGDDGKPYFLGFCLDCKSNLTPEGFLAFGVIT